MPKSRHQQHDQSGLEYLVGELKLTDRTQYTVANLPAPSAANAGSIVWVTNGNGGQPGPAVSTGAAWLRMVGAAVSTTP